MNAWSSVSRVGHRSAEVEKEDASRGSPIKQNTIFHSSHAHSTTLPLLSFWSRKQSQNLDLKRKHELIPLSHSVSPPTLKPQSSKRRDLKLSLSLSHSVAMSSDSPISLSTTPFPPCPKNSTTTTNGTTSASSSSSLLSKVLAPRPNGHLKIGLADKETAGICESVLNSTGSISRMWHSCPLRTDELEVREESDG